MNNINFRDPIELYTLSDFHPGQKVIWIEILYQKGVKPEKGIVSSIGKLYVFVQFYNQDGSLGSSMACRPERLKPI